MITLYSMPSSGNSYKVRLLLNKIDLQFRHVECESGSKLLKSKDFLDKNPFGKVPMLELIDGRLILESNAIVLYLAKDTPYLPDDPYEKALVHQWMFWEQNVHEPTIAVRAAILNYPDRAHLRKGDILEPLAQKGYLALAQMEAHLKQSKFLIRDTITAADICLYAYTHSAGSHGGFDMDRFPAIQKWLGLVEADPKHVPITWVGRN